ncbi:pseudoazurin [Noviherbaspirillum cavernae]|uniref:Pseudoazurin n=1 Tax=Noviherbaspirillum cavernae TaxID=2320862 RepID=A0A418WZN8_9BURK|nr:pseudoazurin [Noviherbaspirillum cavernae]RJG05689.1 pseudoazurin [Noviherbaspirillum cavernae]
MKKVVLATALSLLSLGAFAAEHQVKMLNSGKEGTMVFEPSFLKVAKGDTVKFVKVDASHNSASAIVPAGAKPWKGKMDEEIAVQLDQEGVYVYVCDPHKMMGMAGVIQVGKPTNLDDAKKESEKLSKTFVMNKDRLTKALEQVK